MGSKKGMNVVMFVGNLGRDAELKFTQNGKPMLIFSAAATTGFGEYEHTEWFNAVMFGERAESVAQYLKKGTTVGVTGELRTRSWEDDQGQKKYKTEVVVKDLTLLGGNGNGKAAGQPKAGAAADDAPAGAEDEIPF